MLVVLFLAGITTASAQQGNLSCSLTSVPVTAPNFGSLSVSSSTTGVGSGWSAVTNVPGNVINASTTDHADATVVLLGSATLTVIDGTNTYSAGNYAGFVIGFSGLNVSALSGVTLRTYLGSTPQETVGSGSLLGVSLGTNIGEVGFYTNRPFNRVEVTYTAALSLTTFQVYNAVMRGTGSCTSLTSAPCNVPVHPRFANYASIVDSVKTGVTGVTTNNWNNLDRVVDADTNNYADLGIPLSVSVLSTATLAVKNVVADYPSGYFAGFDIENRGLLGLGLLSNITINIYRDDTLVGSASGTNLLLGASLFGNSGRQTIGFVTATAFDEVQLTMNQPIGVNLGTTRVYGAVIRNFCAGPTPPCNIPVAQKELSHPVYINTPRTGFVGAACALCRIDSIGNLLDGDTLNAASIFLTAGVATTGSVSVRSAVGTYPSGTYAGFEIANPTLLDLNVLGNVSVSIYRGGDANQTFSGSGLLVSLPSSLIKSAPSRTMPSSRCARRAAGVFMRRPRRSRPSCWRCWTC